MPIDELARLVVRYRDSPSPMLQVEWALLRLLDATHCSMLQNDLHEHASQWEVCAATGDLWKMLPDRPGLYMFVWRPPFGFQVAEGRRSGDLYQVLYVGQAGAGHGTTSTLRDRYKTYTRHIGGSADLLWQRDEPISRASRLDRYLKLRPLEYWFTVVEDRAQIKLLEDRLLQLLNPPVNRDRRPRLVRGEPRPAFPR